MDEHERQESIPTCHLKLEGREFSAMKIQKPRNVSTKRQVQKPKPLHQQVIDNLRDMIIEGELDPGSRVPERELCEMFGISRTPFREALKVLESERLVELIPNRGAIVSQPTSELAEQKFELLTVLEGAAARWASERATDAEINNLAEISNKMIAHFESHDVARYFRVDQQFHQAIVNASKNDDLIQVHKNLLMHLRRSRYKSLLSQDDHLRQSFVDDHREIVAAIRARNGQRAEQAIVKHNQRVIAMVKGNLTATADGSRSLL
jgi:DNA-binding GntR family transcriptional regulator